MPKCSRCGEDKPRASTLQNLCAECLIASTQEAIAASEASQKFPTLRTAFSQPGWVCPKCGSVYSPHTGECWRCNPPTVWTSTIENTGSGDKQGTFTF